MKRKEDYEPTSRVAYMRSHTPRFLQQYKYQGPPEEEEKPDEGSNKRKKSNIIQE